MVALLDTPEWAATPAAPCEAPGSEPRARAPRPETLVHYRAVVRALLDAAAQEGATLRYWSAWNEPNHAYFLARQRDDCDGAGNERGTPSVDAYVSLVRALDAALATAPGAQRVLGELAGTRRDGRNTAVSTFIRALRVTSSAPRRSSHSTVTPAAGTRCPTSRARSTATAARRDTGSGSPRRAPGCRASR
jgi:hypothetical protein